MEPTSEGSQLVAVPFLDARKPPHPLDAEWYMNSGGQTYGPYSGHVVAKFVDEGRISAETEVAKVGDDRWTTASQEPTLAQFFRQLPPVQSRFDAPVLGAAVSAAAGATIVQVTNHLAPQPSSNLLMEDGPAKDKSAGVALLLSLLCVGLGQIYNGQVVKGILMFVGCVLTWFVLLGWIVMIWSWVDAYSNAKAMRRRYERRLMMGIPV